VHPLKSFRTAEEKAQLLQYNYIFIQTSTWSSHPPSSAEGFLPLHKDDIHSAALPAMKNAYFAVFALGSSAYQGFCEYGTKVDIFLCHATTKYF
jgi:sulfite reductase alpha subunit-like flavoprotein